MVVSRLSRNDRNPTPRSSRAVTTSIRCRNDRPSRSSRHTTGVSPGRSCSSTASSCGRRSKAPDGPVGPHLPAAGRGQLVDLQVRVLLGRRDPRVAQQVRPAPDRTANPLHDLVTVRRFPDTGCATQPVPAARSPAGAIRPTACVNPYRPTNERLRDVFVARLTGPLDGCPRAARSAGCGWPGVQSRE